MFQFTENHHQGAISSAWLKLHIWYLCVVMDVVSVMAAYAAITLTLVSLFTQNMALPDSLYEVLC